MDHHFKPLPLGLSGQLHVGGAGLARGYLNRPGLTASRFQPNPFATQPGERLYASGDLGRMLEPGLLDYQGRMDQGVKISGYRIEIGEMEAALLRHEHIHEVAVLVRDVAVLEEVTEESPSQRLLRARWVCVAFSRVH